jgi:hypothetical protein
LREVRDRLNLTLNGHVPSKKNSLRRVMVRGRMLTIPSKAYLDWESETKQLIRPMVREMPSPVAIRAVYFPGRLQCFDMGNAQESIHDLLVSVGAIKDDNLFELQSFACELGGLEQGAERVEVEIISYWPTAFDDRLSLLRSPNDLKTAVLERKGKGQKITQKAFRAALWDKCKNIGEAIAQ